MRLLLLLLLLLVLATARAAVRTRAEEDGGSRYIANEWVMAMHAVSAEDLPSAADALAHGVTLVKVSYSPESRMAILLLSGDPANVAAFATSERMPVTASRIQTTPNARVLSTAVPWGAQRVSQRNLPLSGSYNLPPGSKRGKGARVYVVDTGVSPVADLEGRIEWAYTAFPGAFEDCNGHATHVAATIAGILYGLATEATIVSVRVLGCDGSGTLFDLAVALAWIRDHAPYTGADVINLSLSYSSYDPTIDTILQQLIARGFTVNAASGNSGSSACYNYPSSSVGVNSVAASNANDAMPSFSNYGSCVTVVAPGVDIVSAWYTGGTKSLDGTSMSAAFASGASALLLADYPYTSPALVTNALRTRATAGLLSGLRSGTPNLLLFVNTLDSPTSAVQTTPAPVATTPAPIATTTQQPPPPPPVASDTVALFNFRLPVLLVFILLVLLS